MTAAESTPTVRFFIDGESCRQTDDWRRYRACREGGTVWGKVRAYARKYGRAVAISADDSATEFYMDGDRLRQHYYAPQRCEIDWPGRRP